MNYTLTYALPIAVGVFLLLFFLQLPDLRRCRLPQPATAPLSENERRDWRTHLPILLITLIYAVTAFYRLGDATAPQTFVPMAGQSAVWTLPDGVYPTRIMLYSGVGHGEYTVFFSEDGQTWDTAGSFSQGHVEVLKWNTLDPAGSFRPRYVALTGSSGEPWLGEAVLLDGDGAPIPASCSIPALADEADTMPLRLTFLNSSYFDEIYHARTAWEHLHGLWPYEISHPPLGKEILSLGILMFGMTPFGWRFMGTLFGVLMLPLMYVLLRKLFGGRAVPCLGTVVFAADFMHYAQTRIATIDTYSVFFILLMYLFLFLWLREGKLRDLALCGLSFGLGAAAKWTSLYAGAGLGVLWLAHWIEQALEGSRQKGRRRDPKRFWLPFLKNSAFCVVFFILIPGLIYYLSYLPYGQAEGAPLFSSRYTRIVLDNQSYMFNYHSSVNATHPYSSRWYQWLLDIRPILYYLDYGPGNTKTSLIAFLSPVLCWGGLLSLFVRLYAALFRRDRTAAFLLVGYLAQLLPWVFISRLTFAYHYFPSSVFLVLSLGYVFALLRDNQKNWRLWTLAFACLSVAVFALFFSTLNGLPVDITRSSHWLRWLPTWPL